MIIREGLIISMSSAEQGIVSRGSIRVEPPAITEITSAAIEARDGEEVIDASGCIVLPGLINTHVHLFQTLLRAVYDELELQEYLSYIYRCGVHLTREDCATGASLGTVEAIRSGVTTLADHHFLNRGSELASGTIEGMLRIGVRSVLARTVMDVGQGLPEEIKESAGTGIDSFLELRNAYSDYEESGRLHLFTGANTPGINASERVCREVAEFAADQKIKSSAHVAEYKGVRDRVWQDYGVDGVVRWLDGIGFVSPELLSVHTVQVDEMDEVAILSDRGASVSHNPFSNLYCGKDIAPVDEMLVRGVPVGLGTDGAANNNGQGILDALRITRLLQRSREDPFAIGAEAGLRMATIDAARALGIDSLVGSLEVGKRADITILDGQRPHMFPFQKPIDHVAHFSKGSDVRDVIIDGQFVLRRGEFVEVDEAKVFEQAQGAGTNLVHRLA